MNIHRVIAPILFLALTTASGSLFANNYYVDRSSSNASNANPGTSAANPWLTIGKCGLTIVAGDTCNVLSGTYDERVTPLNSGTSGARIVYNASKGVKVRGFTLSSLNYITVQGFEFTNTGMASEGARSIDINSPTTGVWILNNTFDHTTYGCIRINGSASFIVRGNVASYCGEAMSIFGSVAGSKTITAGVNDQLRFSVQGGPSQTLTLPPGTYNGTSQWGSLSSSINASMKGATIASGAFGVFELRSNTLGPLSTITLEPVPNNCYSTFGFAVGAGTMNGNEMFWQGGGTGNTNGLIEQNRGSYLGDYAITGFGDTRMVIRNNTWVPVHPYTSNHVDGTQGTSATYLLYEGNISVNNNNADNHTFLYQDSAGKNFIIRFNVVNNSSGGIDCSRGGATTTPGCYIYNNTLYNSAPHIGNGIQVYDGNARNNLARNNIYYNATSRTVNPYVTGTSIDKDYDLWCCGTGNPSEKHDVNRDPLFSNAQAGDFHLTAMSPARKSGGPLTTATGTGNSSTSLTVANPNMFQDGWAGVNPDCIAVGSVSNIVCIVSINYRSNIITLVTPISWNTNDSVWLSRKSDGVKVLSEDGMDIGAYAFTVGNVEQH